MHPEESIDPEAVSSELWKVTAERFGSAGDFLGSRESFPGVFFFCSSRPDIYIYIYIYIYVCVYLYTCSETDRDRD